MHWSRKALFGIGLTFGLGLAGSALAQDSNRSQPQGGQRSQSFQFNSNQNPNSQKGGNDQADQQSQNANGAQSQSSQNQQARSKAGQEATPGNAQNFTYFTENLFTPEQNLFWFVNQPSGMELVSADDALREQLKLPKDQGIVVVALDANSSPAQAGIQQNDVLLTLGDAPLGKPDDLDDHLKQASEEPVPLLVLRGGKQVKLQVQPYVRVTLGPVPTAASEFWIGVSVTPIGPALRSQLQVAGDRGLAVIEVVKDGPAAKAGIKQHDILLSFAGQPLVDQDQLVKSVQANGEKSASLELIREGKAQTVEVVPQRRQTAVVRGRLTRRGNHDYSVVQFHPGAVLSSPNQNFNRWFYQSSKDGQKQQPQNYSWNVPQFAESAQQGQPQGSVSKRLDELDGEIKQLRKAIEELSGAMKRR
jgi:serine protease Do